MVGSKMKKKLNEGIINLAGIDMLIIIITLEIHVLYLKKWFDFGSKYKKND